jgi:hypothetical protein
MRISIDYTLTLEEYLDSRREPVPLSDVRIGSAIAASAVSLLFIGVGLSFGYDDSIHRKVGAPLIVLGLLSLAAAIPVNRYFTRDTILRHVAALASDYGHFNASPCTFKADEGSWSLSSAQASVSCRWEDLRVAEDFPLVVALSGLDVRCVVPKSALTSDELRQLQCWIEQGAIEVDAGTLRANDPSS